MLSFLVLSLFEPLGNVICTSLNIFLIRVKKFFTLDIAFVLSSNFLLNFWVWKIFFQRKMITQLLDWKSDGFLKYCDLGKGTFLGGGLCYAMVGNSPRNKKAPKKTKNTLMDTTLFGLLFKPFDDKYFALVNFAIRLLFGLLKKMSKISGWSCFIIVYRAPDL